MHTKYLRKLEQSEDLGDLINWQLLGRQEEYEKSEEPD